MEDAPADESSVMLDTWQEAWEADKRGEWTHVLIPDVQSWVQRKHSALTFYVTQLITGHGCFRRYLNIIGRERKPGCWYCDCAKDNAEHTFFVCERWKRERDVLAARIGRITPENVVQLMLQNEKNWSYVSEFTRDIHRIKEADERLRRRMAEATRKPGTGMSSEGEKRV